MIYARVTTPRRGLRLHLNENTAGCSPAVLSALQAIGRSDIAEYPDYAGVTRRCEDWLGVAPGWVQITNGLDEGLHVVAQAAKLIDPDFEGIVVEPAFEMYDACIAAVGGKRVTVAPTRDLRFSIDAVLAAISPQTRLIYLCDPNNPTGQPILAADIEQIAQAAPDAIVLVDEAYADFSGRTLVGAPLDRFRNLVVGRSFAKAHGLAGLRVGALVAHPDTLAPLRRILPPYSVNTCAIVALEASLADPDYLAWYVGEAKESRQLIYDWCGKRGFSFLSSEANFVLMEIGPDASSLVSALENEGIFIRDRSRQPGCTGRVRITAGVVEDTRRCLAAMERWYATRAN
jgi:histidinol-phosphate aminotransferase